MVPFRIGKDVAANIRELRRVLGSRTRELSRDDLAALLNERLSEADAVSGSGIRWWEQREGEPGIRVIAIMAELAGVSFEAFALGVPGTVENLLDPATARGLNPEEIGRAVRTAESERLEQAAKASGVPRGPKKRR
jgi:transcriptional regulator with XRE-family HTH domain